MKIDFPKIVKVVDLGEYAEALRGQQVFVWVNPPTQTLTELGNLFEKMRDSEGVDGQDEYLKIMSELLSQGEKDTHFSAKELRELVDKTVDTDPAFWIWLQNRILEAITDHRSGRKKN